MVRDGSAGAAMARVMSFVMMVFMLVPILAPSVGQLVLLDQAVPNSGKSLQKFILVGDDRQIAVRYRKGQALAKPIFD